MTKFVVWSILLAVAQAHNQYQLNEFHDLVQQKTYGNRISQCPCVIHTASRQCISYDSRYLASNVEEAILAFIDLSNQQYQADVVSSATFRCSSSQCLQCFGILFYRLQDIGLVPKKFSPSIRLLARSELQPAACPKFKFARPSILPPPPTLVPSYIQSTIAAGLQYELQNENSAQADRPTAFGANQRDRTQNIVLPPERQQENNNNNNNNIGLPSIVDNSRPSPQLSPFPPSLSPRPGSFRPGPRPRPSLFRPFPPRARPIQTRPRPFQPQPFQRPPVQQWQQQPTQTQQWNQQTQQQSQWNNGLTLGSSTGAGLGSSLGSLGSVGNFLGQLFSGSHSVGSSGGGSGTGSSDQTHIILGTREKRQTNEEIIGTRYTIGCTNRGEVENEMLSLCGSCWMWRELPVDYFPRLVNELNCRENDFCLSGWGECKQQYRNIDVLKRVGGRWVPTVITTGSCCDCRVKAGTEIHSLVVGGRRV